MKTIGLIALVVGAFAFLIGFNMDTSVATDFGGQRVHNIGLMNDRQNIIIFAGVMAVVGALFVGLAGKSNQPSVELVGRSSPSADTRKCPFCAEIVKTEAIICRFCQKDLPPLPASTLKTDTTISDSTDSQFEAAESLTTEQLQIMEKLSITYDGEKYHFQGYRYEKLSDAENYAKLQANKG